VEDVGEKDEYYASETVDLDFALHDVAEEDYVYDFRLELVYHFLHIN
jgi:hypothetical protein